MFFQAILRCSFSAAERERRRRGKAAGHHFICKVIIWVKWNIFLWQLLLQSAMVGIEFHNLLIYCLLFRGMFEAYHGRCSFCFNKAMFIIFWNICPVLCVCHS